MLTELRRGLANTLQVGMPTARVLPAPPVVLEWPEGGPLVWVRPADNWIDAWMTFGTTGRGTINLEVVVVIPAPDADDADTWYAALEDAVDPTSDSASVFAAVRADPSLGLTDFEASAEVMLSTVNAPDVGSLGELNAVGAVAVVPVQIIVQRS